MINFTTTALGHMRHFLALGIRENGAVPNDGPPSILFMRGDKLPWCAGLVLTCLELEGVQDLDYWHSRNVQAFEDRSKRLGFWFPATEKPSPGDVIFFHARGASDAGTGRHCGMVSRVEGQEIHTIEGNVGDKMAAMRYSGTDSRISGYGRWEA